MVVISCLPQSRAPTPYEVTACFSKPFVHLEHSVDVFFHIPEYHTIYFAFFPVYDWNEVVDAETAHALRCTRNIATNQTGADSINDYAQFELSWCKEHGILFNCIILYINYHILNYSQVAGLMGCGRTYPGTTSLAACISNRFAKLIISAEFNL